MSMTGSRTKGLFAGSVSSHEAAHPPPFDLSRGSKLAAANVSYVDQGRHARIWTKTEFDADLTRRAKSPVTHGHGLPSLGVREKAKLMRPSRLRNINSYFRRSVNI